MITLNSKKFAKNDKEFKSSLFEKGGTCTGFYRVLKNKIKLFDMQHNLIGVIVNNVLASATPQATGGFWYCYANPDLIGEYASFEQYQNEIHALTEKFNLKVKT